MTDQFIRAVKFLQWQNNGTLTFKETIEHYGEDYINNHVVSKVTNQIDRKHKSLGFRRQKTRNNGKIKSIDQMIDRRRSLGIRYKPYNKYRGHD